MSTKELVSLKTLHLVSEKSGNDTQNAFSICVDDGDVRGWGEIFWTTTPTNSSKIQIRHERSYEHHKIRSKTPILINIEKRHHRPKKIFSNLRELKPKLALIPKVPIKISHHVSESVGLNSKNMSKAHQRAKLFEYQSKGKKRSRIDNDCLIKSIKINSVIPVKGSRRRERSKFAESINKYFDINSSREERRNFLIKKIGF
ncbi:hypothetical protein SteCoe_32045 [Stentor coeruleus]|uniref:Uncharacterized protein n=1 Tax=Stentor coeruleus TaxID=5963 RepID=A0A1R2AZW4_9CILI|nr:hypothetical protein SteCoe_32045 [Stentor coeruleus]